MVSTKVKTNENDRRVGLQPSLAVEKHQYFPTKDGYIINIRARTARVPPYRTAVLDKHKFVSKQVFQKNDYYQSKIFVF